MATHSKSAKVIAQKLVNQLDRAKAQPSDWIELIEDIAKELEKQKKIELLPEIIKHVKELSLQAGQPLTAYVRSAVELSETQKAALQKKIGQKFGEGVGIQTELDPSLLGGVVIRWEDNEIDASVRKKIQIIRESIQ